MDEQEAISAVQESKIIITAGQLAIAKKNLDSLLNDVLRPMMGKAVENEELLQELYHRSYEMMLSTKALLKELTS